MRTPNEATPAKINCSVPLSTALITICVVRCVIHPPPHPASSTPPLPPNRRCFQRRYYCPLSLRIWHIPKPSQTSHSDSWNFWIWKKLSSTQWYVSYHIIVYNRFIHCFFIFNKYDQHWSMWWWPLQRSVRNPGCIWVRICRIRRRLVLRRQLHPRCERPGLV